MNKTERDELRKDCDHAKHLDSISVSVNCDKMTVLLDALDEAEERLELYRRDSDAMQLSYIQKLDEAERKLAEAEDRPIGFKEDARGNLLP